MAEKLAKSLIGMMGGLLSLSFGKQLIVFIISMLPILELRGGLIAASLLKLPPLESYIIAIVGNVIPVPFILLLINKILRAMEKSRFKLFNGIHSFLHKKIMKNILRTYFKGGIKISQRLSLRFFYIGPLFNTKTSFSQRTVSPFGIMNSSPLIISITSPSSSSESFAKVLPFVSIFFVTVCSTIL